MTARGDSNLVHLHADGARAEIDPVRGATITKLTFADGFSPLWLPAEPISPGQWPGGGIPVCFPFAGRVWHDGTVGKYALPTLEETPATVFAMPIHGFAARMPWKVVRLETNCATLELEDTPETRVSYPFAFRVRLTCQLSAKKLQVQLYVEALGGQTREAQMPVAAGFHPYFRLPGASALFSDYELSCNATSSIEVTPAGAAGQSSAIQLPLGSSRWTKNLADPFLHNRILGANSPSPWPAECAIRPVGKNVDDRPLTFRSDTDKTLRHVVLWAKPDQGFICVEPWMALPDAVHHGGGCVFMKPTQHLTLGFSIF